MNSARRLGMLRPLQHRDFAKLWTGLFVSLIGDGVYLVAIAWQVYDLSDSPAALAIVGLAWSLPQVLLVLAAGALSDRFDRRALMVAGDLTQLVSISAIGILSLAGGLSVPILVGLVAIYGAGQAIFHPSLNAIVPMIVPDRSLVEANALGRFVRPFAMMLIGPLVGGALIAALGVGWAFVVDAATFGFSAGMIASIRTRARVAEEERRPMRQDVMEGMRFVRHERWLFVALIASAVTFLLTWGPWETLIPFVVRNDLGGGAEDLGLVFGVGGVGAVAAAAVLAQRGRLPRRPITALYLAWALMMFALAGFGVVTSLWQAMLMALLLEGSLTVLVVIWYTALQRLVPGRLLGRVSSIDWLMTQAGVPLSFALVGPAAAAFGVRPTLVVAGLGGAAIVLGFLFFVPGSRAPERDGRLAAAAPTEAPVHEPNAAGRI